MKDSIFIINIAFPSCILYKNSISYVSNYCMPKVSDVGYPYSHVITGTIVLECMIHMISNNANQSGKL